MDARIVWQNGFNFETQIRQHRFSQDAKVDQGGTDLGPSPKELLLAAIIGCTGMDVVSLMNKMRSPFTSCVVATSAQTTETHPKIFPRVDVIFKVEGPEVKPDVVIKAVKMSLTKYCGVSAMVNATSPIHYQVFVNDQMIDQGQADFTATKVEG